MQPAVYIMASRSRTLYVGVTTNIRARIENHRQGQPGAFTTRYHIHRLVYMERTASIRDAIAREKQIKGWRRSRKIALIESLNPAWDDLADLW